METFSIRHWLIVLAIVAAIFVPMIVAVRTERSDRKASRTRYGLVFVLAVVVPIVINTLLSGTEPRTAVYGVWIVICVALQVWFLRVLVQRLRDAGMGKTLAYWAIVPLVGFIISLGMLFPPSNVASTAAA